MDRSRKHCSFYKNKHHGVYCDRDDDLTCPALSYVMSGSTHPGMIVNEALNCNHAEGYCVGAESMMELGISDEPVISTATAPSTIQDSVAREESVAQANIVPATHPPAPTHSYDYSTLPVPPVYDTIDSAPGNIQAAVSKIYSIVDLMHVTGKVSLWDDIYSAGHDYMQAVTDSIASKAETMRVVREHKILEDQFNMLWDIPCADGVFEEVYKRHIVALVCREELIGRR